MHPIFDDLDRAIHKRGLRLTDRLEMEETLPYKKKAEKFFIGLSLLCNISYFFQSVIFGLQSSQKKELSKYKFLKTWLARYFYFRGIRYYKTKPFPTNPERPILIILPRYTEILSLFVITLFDFPVILPLSPAISSFRLHYRIPDPLSKIIKKMGYPDHGLNHDSPLIASLLKQGHCVVAHPNEGYFNSRMLDFFLVHANLVSLLKLPNSDLYFLNLDSAHTYNHCSYYIPTQIRCDLEGPDFVFMTADTGSDQEKIALMTQFFGADHVRIIVPS